MILNHHRLCQQEHHTQLPLNLFELFQTTQQIGAFQLRVRQSLSQVLFSTFHGTHFWEYWSQWMLGVLQAWTDRIPPVCLTPGLLPLHPGRVAWSWRETVVIQALGLEAAHQLVETLPLSLEALNVLLGFQDALIEDSSTIDPKGFETVPLGLQLIQTETSEQITVQTMPSAPAAQHLPSIYVKICPQAPQLTSGAVILSRWLWEMTQRFGPEVSYVGLILIQEMAQLDFPWEGTINCNGVSLLVPFSEESDSPAQGLENLVRRLELIQHATIQWEEQRLAQRQTSVRQEKLWQVTEFQVCRGLSIEEENRGGQPTYQTRAIESVYFSTAPGAWCDRLIQIYGADATAPLVTLGQIANQLLQIDPISQRLAAQIALFLTMQFWQDASRHWTIRTLLETVESPEKIHLLENNAMRRESLYQSCRTILEEFQSIGWQVSKSTLTSSLEPGANDSDWLDEPLFIQIQPEALPISRENNLSRSKRLDAPTQAAPVASLPNQRMDKISSRSLEHALASKGMSQAKLARTLNLDRSTINRWVNGSRPIHPRYRPALWTLLGNALRQS
ncbi:MAG: helix-turn-helix transcriptional regulator [Cyanobacteria bacterium P01_F01_bin.42]